MSTENDRSQTEIRPEFGNNQSPPPRMDSDMNKDMRPRAVYQEPATQRKSPVLASILSIMPGLGQIYVGYYQQGFVFIGIFASTIAILASGTLSGLEPALGIFLGFFHIFNMIDANRRANHFNQVKAGMSIEEVPDDFKLPSSGGSTTVGVVLVAIGVLFLLDLNYNVSMEWVEDWWPAILVAIGINMIVKSRRNKS